MLVIPALGKLRQEDHHQFKTSLGYIENSRSAWATKQDPISIHTHTYLF
jgi:hypothetical protein